MSYRNITVDGVKHKYTIGKTHLKVHGFQAIEKYLVGSMHFAKCWCGDICEEEPSSLRVTPEDVAKFIRSQ